MHIATKVAPRNDALGKSTLVIARRREARTKQSIPGHFLDCRVTRKAALSHDIRPLAQLAYAEEFEGDAERRTTAYSSVREDSSTASLSKLPAEVELCKRSILYFNFFSVNTHPSPSTNIKDF
ncbi:MAG: palindromic element RPE1 domain-containing protein [Rickettsia endosymbiont of Pseudomimeciton antennatum]|nr:palindromic element RPE1 domain-containing protein [Rickettsia endosymbiont of Pseudomimeciton antennatum]